MAIVPILLLSVIINVTYVSRSIKSESENLYSRSEVLSKQVVTSGYLDDQGDVTMELRLSELAQLISGRVMLVDSSLRVIYDSYSIDKGKVFLWENVTKSANGEMLTYVDRKNNIITTTIPITTINDENELEIVGVLLASESVNSISENLNYIISIELIVLFLLIGFAILLGIILGNRYSSPITDASSQLDTGIKGDKINSIDVKGYSEIEELASQFNTYVNKMETIDESRQEFVSNESHELKTPLTSMKVLADSLIGMGDAPVELYQEFIGDISQEIERETGIINDLLTMVRMDKSNANLNISTVNVNELVESILKRLRPIAEKQNVELVLDSFRPITAEVDEIKLGLAISNLIENGIK